MNNKVDWQKRLNLMRPPKTILLIWHTDSLLKSVNMLMLRIYEKKQQIKRNTQTDKFKIKTAKYSLVSCYNLMQKYFIL
jgi:hypothetical protein